MKGVTYPKLAESFYMTDNPKDSQLRSSVSYKYIFLMGLSKGTAYCFLMVIYCVDSIKDTVIIFSNTVNILYYMYDYYLNDYL